MRVIARGTLYGYLRNHLSKARQKVVKDHLDSWYAEVSKAAWKTSAELKSQYGSASIISAGRVVFNIKGNDYRLVVAINYAYQVLFIQWLGTHAEYDKIDVAAIEYDEERYADPPNS